MDTSRSLKRLGMVLFLLGLITGFMVMGLRNPRMGLSAHLEGVMNGTFLVVAGFLWNELNLGVSSKKVLFGLLVFGTFSNWITTLMAAFFGTSKMTPIAGAGFSGTGWQESLVNGGLILVGLSMVGALSMIVYGLKGNKP